MPARKGGGELKVGNSKLEVRLRKSIGIEGRGEQNTLPEFETQADATVYIMDRKDALKCVHTGAEGLIFRTNGFRLENEQVGSAVVWKEVQE
jgi:hypothetical protein